jgi:DNA repair exonuclease SbcCD ATPase subunit
MDKPTRQQLDEARDVCESEESITAPMGTIPRALFTLNSFRTWADAELELAAKQEKHLALKLLEERERNERLESDRNAAVTAHRERNERLEADLADAKRKIVEQRAQLTSLEHLRYNHDQAVRERSFVSQELADANEKIRVLQADVAKGQREFDRRLKAKDAKIAELRRETERLTTNLVDTRRREITKGAEITKLRAARDQAVNLQEALTTDLGGANHALAMLRAENEKLRNNYASATKSRWGVQSPTARPQWVPETSAAVLEAQIEALSGEKPEERLRTAEEQQAQLDEMIATLNAGTPKGKSYADAELGVIQDCLEALERIPATQRAAVTQYLTSRAHTAAWGAMPVPQHPAF